MWLLTSNKLTLHVLILWRGGLQRSADNKKLSTWRYDPFHFKEEIPRDCKRIKAKSKPHVQVRAYLTERRSCDFRQLQLNKQRWRTEAQTCSFYPRWPPQLLPHLQHSLKLKQGKWAKKANQNICVYLRQICHLCLDTRKGTIQAVKILKGNEETTEQIFVKPTPRSIRK